MDRRTFLLATAAGATASALSTWFTAHAGDESKTDPQDAKAGGKFLKSAYRVARDTGRPLLVVVDQAYGDTPAIHRRMQTLELFGVTINHASNELMADLAVCEVVFTTAADLALLVPAAAKLTAPVLFLVESSNGKPTLQGIEIKLDDLPTAREEFNRVKGYRPARAAAEKAVRARMARASQTLRTALAADAKMLARRADTNRKAIGDEAWAKTAAALRQGRSLPYRDVFAAAALIRWEAERNAKDKKAFLAALATARIETLKKSPPPGARWAVTTGCGLEIEGEIEGERATMPAMLCGVGHVAPLSARFLMHYTKKQ